MVTLHTAYSISGPWLSAWFTGIVHGVVVQITAKAPTNSGALGASTISNATSICVETMSSYSTSASASAVFSTGDHITGLAPRYSWPLSANLSSSPTMAASASYFIVRYGSAQSPITPSRSNSAFCTATHFSA
ncbi:hypothetical protein C8J46_102233 [Sphingomonas sp. PP-F2F-A104-K0414]|nr:hypothetical protein C8J46_102233 [Sphingomonas sp. PP-F2F-A104-K0414]